MGRGTTTQQGYGWDHQKIRAALLRNHVDGTPCDRCWKPMHRNPASNYDGRTLQAGHPHHRPRAIDPTSKADHLEHATCNETGLLTPEPTTSTSREW